jgi:hypothetical protein
MENVPSNSPTPTRWQALQVLFTVEKELSRVFSDLSRCSDGHPLDHDSFYGSQYQAANKVPLLFHGDRIVEKARILVPIMRSMKDRFKAQVRHYRAWRMLVAKGLVAEDAIHLPIDESSSVNKPAILKLMERLAAFKGFGPAINIPESKHFRCSCWTCGEVLRGQDKLDSFVQQGHWLAALVLRSGSNVDEVCEALIQWGGFGEPDPWHKCYVPDENLNSQKLDQEMQIAEWAKEKRGGYWDFESTDIIAAMGMLFGEEIEENTCEDKAVGRIVETHPEEFENGDIGETALRYYTDVNTENEFIEDIDDEPAASETLIDHKLTLAPTSAPTEPCPEHCPSRRRRLRDNIHNPRHTSCTYHCHTSHAPFEFEQSGEQVGFWLPHGLQNSITMGKWAATTLNRMKRFEAAWKGISGDDCTGVEVAAEVMWCVWDAVVVRGS